MESSRYSHVSLGSMADKIQLTDRQLQLLDMRRKRLDGVEPSGTLLTLLRPRKAPRERSMPLSSGGRMAASQERPLFKRPLARDGFRPAPQTPKPLPEAAQPKRPVM